MCEAKDHPPDKELVPARKKGEPVLYIPLSTEDLIRKGLPHIPGNLARVLASAAFPDGLPQLIGASVATHSTDLSLSSQVDFASEHLSGCPYLFNCGTYPLSTSPRLPL
jgi:hypothetical protein